MPAEKTVLIECLQKRTGGSKHDLYGKTYHFKPDPTEAADPQAAHVCAVPFDHARAIYRFLAIKSGFKLVDDSAELPERPANDPGQTIQNERAISANKPAMQPVFIENPDTKERIELTAMSPEDLRIFAKEQFKISIHHKWTDQTVIQKIVEATRVE